MHGCFCQIEPLVNRVPLCIEKNDPVVVIPTELDAGFCLRARAKDIEVDATGDNHRAHPVTPAPKGLSQFLAYTNDRCRSSSGYIREENTHAHTNPRYRSTRK